MNKAIAKMIDHAVLHPTQTWKDLEQAINLSLQLDIATLCVKPYMVEETAKAFTGSNVLASTVIGFPHGSNTTSTKTKEAINALEQGALELDMVANIGMIKDRDWDYLQNEVNKLAQLCHESSAVLKVIVETDFLTTEEIVSVTQCIDDSDADYIKTSTGFGYTKRSNGYYAYDGALLDNVKLMKQNIKGILKIKASGGIRDYKTLMKFKEAGATRIGTSSTSQIMSEANAI